MAATTLTTSSLAKLASGRVAPNPIPTKSNVTDAKPALSPSVDAPLAGGDSDSEELFDIAGCLAQVRQGDEEAARLLINRLYPLVIKLVRSHLPRRSSEEDLAQMVFIKVFAKIEQFSGAVPLEHWVSRIAVNTCLNQIQAEKIRPELRWADLSEEEEKVVSSLASSADPFQRPDEHLASKDLLDRLLATLKSQDRLLINLINLEGRSIEEVKRLTGWNSSLIKVRAFRARHKLRKRYSELMEEKKK